MDSHCDWKKTILPSAATLRDAAECLEKSTLQIALVLSEEGSLLGTVTDGDIRRGLLRGVRMSSRVENIYNTNCFVVSPDITRDAILHLMRVNKIYQIPVVDEQRRVVDLHILGEMTDAIQRDNTMVIMAGGRGERMRPHTEKCPKPMLHVAGKPILEHIIERAASDGIKNLLIAINYLGHMIEEHFADGAAHGVTIQYLKENQPLGTAGALSLISNIPKQPIVITNGDVLLDASYGAILDYHEAHSVCATMAVRLHEWEHPFGVVQTSGIDIVGFEEKPVHHTNVNAGVYVLNPECLVSLEPGKKCDMPTLFLKLLSRGLKTVVYPVHEPWIDVGRFSDYEYANKNYREIRKTTSNRL